MTAYLRENPPLLRQALVGLIVASGRATAERERHYGHVTTHVADLRTSVADWRELVALRVAEQVEREAGR